jgi:hypothetical protein
MTFGVWPLLKIILHHTTNIITVNAGGQVEIIVIIFCCDNDHYNYHFRCQQDGIISSLFVLTSPFSVTTGNLFLFCNTTAEESSSDQVQ